MAYMTLGMTVSRSTIADNNKATIALAARLAQCTWQEIRK